MDSPNTSLAVPLDGAKAFLLYLAFNGDAEQTAVSLACPLAEIKALAARETWDAKLAEMGRDVDTGPEEQITINRTVNYVQAHRMRSVLDSALEYVRDELATEGGARKLLWSPGRDGDTFSARGLTDLVKAMEACQQMTERALGSTEDATKSKGKGADGMYVSVMKAMAAADGVGLSAVDVVREQLKAPVAPGRRSLKAAIAPKPE